MFGKLHALKELEIEETPPEPDSAEKVYVYEIPYPPKPMKWNKSRGQAPESVRTSHSLSREASFNFSLDDEDAGSSGTPYRLPRLSPQGDITPQLEPEHVQEERNSPMNDKVWSRYGYEKIIRIPELAPQVRVLVPPPNNYLQLYRHQTPRFKNAAITPTCRSVAWSANRDLDDAHLKLYKSPQSHVHDDAISSRSARLEPTPTPISRSDSPAKSVKSIHWILGHNRYHTFDKTGRSHIQGPYSREFNVTCATPQNWLRMKLGRSKTMLQH